MGTVNLWWLKSIPEASTVDLRQLEVEIPGLDPDSFRQISARFPSLEHINVGSSCGLSFVTAVEIDAALVESAPGWVKDAASFFAHISLDTRWGDVVKGWLRLERNLEYPQSQVRLVPHCTCPR